MSERDSHHPCSGEAWGSWDSGFVNRAWQQLRAGPAWLGLGVLIAAVVLMHSMGMGHGGTVEPQPKGHGTHAVAGQATQGVEAQLPPSGCAGACVPEVRAIDETHAMTGLCLAVLTSLLLLLLVRHAASRSMIIVRAMGAPRRVTRSGRGPPLCRAPSLSQLGVLRI